MTTLKLYRHPLSGNAHRAELMLSLLGLKAELIDVDLLQGEQKQPEFLKKNIFGQVPALEDDDITIADSNAILVYLAKKYDSDQSWLPVEPEPAAHVQRFLSIAQGPVMQGPATARLANVFGVKLDHDKAISTAHHVLNRLNEHLQNREWLVTEHPTIADISNYTYIAHAPEGDVSLQQYPHIISWIKRIEALPGFIPMQHSAVGLAA